MLEAAYNSLDDGKRQATHLKIGRLLRDAMLAEQRSPEHKENMTMLSAVLEQLNHASLLVTDPRERIQLASMNLQAAESAKLAGVWEVAASYAAEGMQLLPEDAWEKQYELCYELHLLRIECEYLNGHVFMGNKLSVTVLKQAKNDNEKAAICYFQLTFNLRDKLKWSLKQGLLGLGYCGLNVPELDQITNKLIEKEEDLLTSQFQKNDVLNVVSSVTSDTPPNVQLIYRIFSRLAASSNAAGLPLLQTYVINRAMRTAVEYGFAEQTMTIVAMYSILLTKQKRYVEAKRFAGVCIELMVCYPQSRELCPVYSMLGSLSLFYSAPFSEALQMQQKSHGLGLEYGDIQWGAIAGLSNGVINQFVMGIELGALSRTLIRLQTLRKKYISNISAGSYYSRLADALMHTPTSNTLSNPLDKTTFLLDEWKVIQSCVLKPFIEHLQLQWFFWSEQTDLAWQAVKTAEPSLELMSGFITPLEHRFLAALLACEKYPEASVKEQKELNTYIECSLDELETLTKLCPENFEHKLLLLRAEQSRALNENMAKVLAHYEQSIQSTRAGGYIQYQALANERCAVYWLTQGFDIAARTKLQQALYLYRLWGCELKCSLLLQKYSRLLGGETESSESSTSSEISSEYSRQGSSVIQANLNFESVMQVAQQISSELNLKKLFSRALYLIADIAGAQSAAVVMNSSEGFVVEARFTVRGDANEELEALRLDECNDLPVSVIKHVLNDETVFNYFRGIETKAVDPQAFNADPYIKSRKPKSILCVPVSYRDEVIGALYLDGHQLFTDDHLSILNMLLSQTVISFENARLFGKSEQLNKALEQKVETRTLALETANEDLQSANE